MAQSQPIMRRHKPTAMALTAVLVLGALALGAAANSDDRRLVRVEHDDQSIEIELKRQQNGTEDKVVVSFDIEDAEFETKYEIEGRAGEQEIKLEATFLALAEYRDGNGNGRYDPGESLISSWALGDDSDAELDAEIQGAIRWSTPTATPVQVGEQSGQSITVVGQLGGGQVTLTFTVFGDFVEVGAASLMPTSVKVDILIEDYPFEDDDTALALLLETKSSTEFEHARQHRDMDSDEDGVAATTTAGDVEITLAFVWKDHADVDGATRPVGTTLLKSEESVEGGEREQKETFALSYGRGQRILHDPEAYVVTGTSAGQATPGPGIAPALLVVLAIVVARRR